MVRITPEDPKSGIIPGQSIIIGNNQGDTYYYRQQTVETQEDPRSKINDPNGPQEKFRMAGEIYSKKPNCWRDHFFRSSKLIRYGNNMDESPVRELKGYKLAMSVLMKTLNFTDGTYYNPRCFCIQPTDMLGQEIGSKSHLQISTSKDVNYRFDEERQMLTVGSDGEITKDPFCSATINPIFPYDVFLLQSQNLAPYYSIPHWKEMDLRGTHNLSSPFPIYIKRHDDFLHSPIFLHTKENWIYTALGQVGVDQYNCPIIGMGAEFIDPENEQSLCGMGMISLGLQYSTAGLKLLTIDHQNPPYWDLFYDKTFICSLGIGGGKERTQQFDLGNNYLPLTSDWRMNIEDKFQPLPTGRQPYHTRLNRIMRAWLKGTNHGNATCPGDPRCMDITASCEPACGDSNMYGYDWVTYDYVLPYPVLCTQGSQDPQILIQLCHNIYNDAGFQAFYPNGAIMIYLSENGNNWFEFDVDFRHIEIEGGKSVYCKNFNYPGGIANYIRIWLSNGTVFRNCTQSRVSVAEPPILLQRHEYPALDDYMKTHPEFPGKFLLSPEEQQRLADQYGW